MKTILATIVFYGLLSTSVFAGCDLTQFRWECEITPKIKPTHTARSLVYCANTNLYLTEAQYNILERYQRAHVNFGLDYNGDYVQGPCILAGR